MLNFFADAPGFEAAIFDPGLDLQWRNDTPYPIQIESALHPETGVATLALWSIGDGRTIDLRGPSVEPLPPPAPRWHYDSTLAAGEVKQVAVAHPGFEVVLRRIVLAQHGEVLHTDTVASTYPLPGTRSLSGTRSTR